MFESHFEPLPKEAKEQIMEMAKTIKPIHDEVEIGLIYLDNEKMREIFSPYIEKYFGKKVKFRRAWVHWMQKGGARPIHHHSHWTYLYYLNIPEGDAGNLLIDGQVVKPLEGNHIMFEKNVKHSITPNATDETRWAFAAECDII